MGLRFGNDSQAYSEDHACMTTIAHASYSRTYPEPCGIDLVFYDDHLLKPTETRLNFR